MIFSDLQKNIWERLYRIKSNRRLGSAYCFSGPTGSGKEYVAIEFTKLLYLADLKYLKVLKKFLF